MFEKMNIDHHQNIKLLVFSVTKISSFKITTIDCKATLSDVLLNHILPRLPPKSIARFRCVSKEWQSLLTSRTMFENMHIYHHENDIKLLPFPETEISSIEFTIIDCEAPPSDKGLTPTCRPIPQFGDTTHYRVHILTSFHGLVCLGIQKNKHDYKYSDLILWNPLTKEYKRLSKFNSYRRCNGKFGLYYSCCEDDYKLLSVSKHVYIYSLKSDSWREVDTSQSTYMLDDYGCWSRGTYLNENLYFLQHHQYNRQLSSIIRFDTKTEELSKIETPNLPYAYSNYFDTILVKSDCIHVCVKYDINLSCDYGSGRKTYACIKLWKLDEYANMKEVFTYQVRQRDDCDIYISCMRPFHLMKNGNWLMMKKDLLSSYKHKIYQVGLKKNKHVQGNIYEDGDFECAEVRVDGNNNIVLEQGRYVETFVSPNQYMK